MSWAVAEAKARFNELVESANQRGPQEITRNGKIVGVLMSPTEWERARRASEENARMLAAATKPEIESGWDALAPSSGELFDVDFSRLGSEARVVEFTVESVLVRVGGCV